MREVGIIYRADGTFNIGVYPDDAQKQYQFIRSGTGDSTFSRVKCKVAEIDTDMWVNEDFDELELPLNDVATVCHSIMVGLDHAYVCGDVVFTGPTNREGFTRGLTPEEAALVLAGLLYIEERITKARIDHALEARLKAGVSVGEHTQR